MADRCDIGSKQKAVIEFLAFEGNAAKEISDRLKNVYGGSALSYAIRVKKTQYAQHYSTSRQCETTHCSCHRSSDCCKRVDSTAASSI